MSYFYYERIDDNDTNDASTESAEINVRDIQDFTTAISTIFSNMASRNNDGYEVSTATYTNQHGSGETDYITTVKLIQLPNLDRRTPDGELDTTVKTLASLKVNYIKYPKHEFTDDMSIDCMIEYDGFKFHMSDDIHDAGTFWHESCFFNDLCVDKFCND